MNDSDLIIVLSRKKAEMNKTLVLAKERGFALAEAERGYKIAKAKFIAKARMDKVPVTLIRDLAQGEVDISKLRLERDKAKVLYLNAIEAINIYKLECRLIEAQVNREWGHA
ncbi:hypothetical protein [Veillonella sp.]|uniref:hypothetical protein n=1 Tax=Veillonella sp. TaxID=1926307 RepID=UPI0025E0C246|nr:hypothetical protein [Veillonella sp.]